MKYRKKPVVIEAVLWTGDNLKEVIAFTGLHPSAKKWTWKEYESVVREQGLRIFTLEDGPAQQVSHFASVGDYIIRGVKGELYPCKPDIFAATYEPALRQVAPQEPHPDSVRLDWLAEQQRREQKHFSDYPDAKTVYLMVLDQDGTCSFVEGDNFRAAIDAAAAGREAT